ncbi:dynein axonemal heavy chain 10-like, partial [Centruroides vittatus]|uniref:dynein axonemal heavy chain 10-like n=1 Tax=Centruroides vittatus TaxID=120091 RepID=UPI003510AFD4
MCHGSHNGEFLLDLKVGHTIPGKSPLVEIEIWRERQAGLSAIVEQLKHKEVIQVQEVLKLAKSFVLSNFLDDCEKLESHLKEAHDNVRFLSTLEKCFQNLTPGTPLNIALETIPVLINGLKMLWILSQHYGHDDGMMSLLERIVWSLCELVTTTCDVKKIFKMPYKEAQDVTFLAYSLLDNWKKSYLKVRANIETFEQIPRWEFDRARLFEKTDYIAYICQDLNRIGKTVGELNSVIGPEMKSLVQDPIRIEIILHKIHNLTVPIETVNFDIFDNSKKDAWMIIVNQILDESDNIQEEIRYFLEEIFDSMPTAESSFDFLQSLKKITIFTSVNEVMERKYNDIMKQYLDELEMIEECFMEKKDNPPIYKDNPPITAAIIWKRSLFFQIKKPMLKFLKEDRLISSNLGKEAQNKYLTLGKKMKEYEEKLFQSWRKKSFILVRQLVQKSILVLDHSVDKSNQQQKCAGDNIKVHMLQKMNYRINFPDALREIINEAKGLKRLGFSISDIVRDVALEEEKFFSQRNGLNKMLKTLKSVLEMMNEAEVKLLDAEIQCLNKTIIYGVKRLNWTSLGIPDYLKRCEQEISKLQSLLNQIQKTNNDLEICIQKISTIKFFDTQPSKGDSLPLCKDYFKFIERRKTELLETAVRQYRALPSLMTNVEGLVCQTNSHKASRLYDYYEYIEDKVYQALIQLVVNNLEYYKEMIKKEEPLFEIEAFLVGTELVLQPTMDQIHKMMTNCCQDIIEGTKCFFRWLHHSCIESEPIKVKNQVELYCYTFFDDVSPHPLVRSTYLAVVRECQSTVISLYNSLHSWTKYSNLWLSNVNNACIKFCSKKPNFKDYDERFQFFTLLKKEILERPETVFIGCIALRFSPLIQTILEHLNEWILAFGKCLNKDANEEMMTLKTEFECLEKKLDRPPQTLEELKLVLETITKIRNMSFEMDVSIKNLEEKYCTLVNNNIYVFTEELESVKNIEQSWNDLVYLSKKVNFCLQSIKEKFTQTTLSDREIFAFELKQFCENFNTAGPETLTDDFEKGLLVFEEFNNKLQNIEIKKEKLANAERLFDLKISSWPDLINIRNKMNNLKQLFYIYEKIKISEEDWCEKLWIDFDPLDLQRSNETFQKEFHMLPDDIKQIPLSHTLKQKLDHTKNSIPLYLILKEEAIRDRHWIELMKITCITFDLSYAKFNLGNLFSLNLLYYEDSIKEIVENAKKELNIEKEVQEIKQLWDQMNFQIKRYFKGTEDRGHILIGVDKILQVLDDNAISLQMMSSSRFVGPFLSIVQEWENTLSHISEVLEIWIMVQKKWISLESIFSESDIVTRLHEQTQKFQKINSSFQKIMDDTSKQPNIKNACHISNRYEELQEIFNGLNECQNSLNNFLHEKRNAFPRFFFLADDELLSVLGSADFKVFQEHLIK